MARPVNQDDRDGIVKKLTGGFDQIFNDAVDVFDRGNFVAGNEERSPIGSAVRAITRANCRIWNRADKSNYSTAVNLGNADICSQYLEDIGEPISPGSVAPPFEGGQCDGISYIFTFSGTWQRRNQFGDLDPPEAPFVPTFSPFTGPITSASIDVNPGTRQILFNTTNGLGQSGQAVLAAWTASQSLGSNGLSFSVARLDGQPDDCGNPPSEIDQPGIPPGLPAFDPNISIDLPGLGPVNVGISLNPDGTINVDLPDIGADFDINPGDGGGDGGGAGGGGGAPTNPGSPGGAANTGDGGDAEGEAPDGSELTGVRVEVVESPPNANQLNNVSIDVFRGIGYVSMGYPGLLGVDTSAAVAQRDQFYHAQQRGLTAWRVRANVGFNLRTTPYYRETEA